MTVGGLEGASTKQGMGAEEVPEGVDVPETVSIRGYIDKARNNEQPGKFVIGPNGEVQKSECLH